MAKTMKERAEERLRKDFYEGAWRFRGTEFLTVTNARPVGTDAVCVHFICGLMWVKARVFGAPERVRMFTGDNAAEECIKWAAQAVHEECERRERDIRPYKRAYENYCKALRGEI